MRSFMDRDFLLSSETARRLFHSYAEKQPIIDYHCHLSPEQIAKDQRYTNITEVWLYGDHYKWRAMRSCGVSEKYITGDASDFEKFRAYCACMPKLIGNPLYHWSHLELRRYFDCDLIISEQNCDEIWRITAEKLSDPQMSARNLILRSGVEVVGTTDDPADSLVYHAQLKKEGFAVNVAPSFRPDKALALHKKGIRDYIAALGKANGVEITDLASLCKAYGNALDRFCALGCRAADHGLDTFLCVMPNEFHANEIFTRAIEKNGKVITEDKAVLFRTQIMRFLSAEYKKRRWVMQWHIGALRNPNVKMLKSLGRDTGFDSISGTPCITGVAGLLNYLEEADILPKTILYSINPSDNAAICALSGSFCKGGNGAPYVTQGIAWWFNDTFSGMKNQIISYAELLPLGKFVGMETDSRSFLSYSRHDYFRRILCSVIGEWMEDGFIPYDPESAGKLISDICYNNAKEYFEF